MGNNMILQTWVDISYGLHHDMLSHVDGVLSVGQDPPAQDGKTEIEYKDFNQI